MHSTTVQYMTTSETAEAFPGQSMALALAQQGMSPSATHLTAKAFQTLQVAGDRVVVVITLHYAMQPLTHGVCRLKAAAHQRFAQSGQRNPHPFLHREGSSEQVLRQSDGWTSTLVNVDFGHIYDEFVQLLCGFAALLAVLGGAPRFMDAPLLRSTAFAEPSTSSTARTGSGFAPCSWPGL